MLSRLVEVGASDPQVALILLRLCGSYCKLIHLARATTPSLVSEALQLFNVEVRQCFAQSIAVEVTDRAWQQAQLNLSHGGLGLRSVSHHSSAAYIASLCASGFGDAQNPHLSHTVDLFYKLVSPSEVGNLCGCCHYLTCLPKGTVNETRGPPVLFVVGSMITCRQGSAALCVSISCCILATGHTFSWPLPAP